MTRFTHLGRPFDPTLPSNRWAVILTATGAAAGMLSPAGRTPLRGMAETGLSVFLTWAIVRELAPDHPHAATLAAAASGAAVWWTGDTNLVALACLMVAARLLVRSTGLRPLLTDVVAVGVFAGVFARTPLSWAAGLAVAAAVALDTSLPEPAPWPHAWLAGAMGVAVTLTAVLATALPRQWSPPGWPTVALAGVATIALLTRRADRPESSADRDDRPLRPARLRAARSVVFGAAVLGTVVGGGDFAHQSWPAWAAIAAVGIWRRQP